MKNMKKGFTIIEMVIVIAIIGILAAVMVPTYSNVVKKANQSAAMQECRAAMTEWLADFDYVNDSPVTEDAYFVVNKGGEDYKYTYENGNMVESAKDLSKVTVVLTIDDKVSLVKIGETEYALKTVTDNVTTYRKVECTETTASGYNDTNDTTATTYTRFTVNKDNKDVAYYATGDATDGYVKVDGAAEVGSESGKTDDTTVAALDYKAAE